MKREHDDILLLLKNLNEATTSDVDESRGTHVVGDKVKYHMYGEGLTEADLRRTIGTRRVAERALHDGQMATVIEASEGLVSRYSLEFEDGYTIKGVTVNEICVDESEDSAEPKAVTEEEAVSEPVVVAEEESASESEVVVEERSVPDKHRLRIAKRTLRMSDVGADIMGGMTKSEAREFLSDQGWSSNKIAALEESVIAEATKKKKDAPDLEVKDVPQTSSPSDTPDLNAEEIGMEDRSMDDLEKPNTTKLDKEHTMVRDVGKDELGNQPDHSAKESVVTESLFRASVALVRAPAIKLDTNAFFIDRIAKSNSASLTDCWRNSAISFRYLSGTFVSIPKLVR